MLLGKAARVEVPATGRVHANSVAQAGKASLGSTAWLTHAAGAAPSPLFPMEQGPDNDTALHLAALYGHAECVRLLLEHGATASVPDEDGGLALHDAAAGG